MDADRKDGVVAWDGMEVEEVDEQGRQEWWGWRLRVAAVGSVGFMCWFSAGSVVFLLPILLVWYHTGSVGLTMHFFSTPTVMCYVPCWWDRSP